MTIAIALKVGDCVVLGADSATTVSNETGVLNVYFNAEKVFNLRKGLPIGLVTYGLGSLDSRSIATHTRDLRERFTVAGDAWRLDPTSYTLGEVAKRAHEFFVDGLYAKEWPKKQADAAGQEQDVFAPMGFMVGGYSAGQRKGEVWIVEVDSTGKSTTKCCFGKDDIGAEAKGQPEPLMRLINGWSPRILEGLVKSGVPRSQAIKFLQSQSMEPLVQPWMPIQDAIDLVRYLIQVTAGFVQFIPGAPTVHEPIDIAAISYHEGFRWVCRKHYYSAQLNP